MDSTHLLDHKDSHNVFWSVSQCKHDFCLLTRKLHRAPLSYYETLKVRKNKQEATEQNRKVHL